MIFSGENLNITWHPNGECIAVGNKDDLIQFIDTKTFKAKGEKQFKFEVNEISWNNAGTNFFLTTGTGALHVLDYPKLSKVDELVAHTANCISIQFRYLENILNEIKVVKWLRKVLRCWKRGCNRNNLGCSRSYASENNVQTGMACKNTELQS